ncbi:MAG: TetR/AcrR family transcriptional regulator [Pseudoclavibacter sp.]
MADDASPSQFHVGLTADKITQAALALTGESHLLGWSIRDLSGRLGVSASVVYHHVGGKDLLARSVAEAALGRLTVPPESLAWSDWFRQLLEQIYECATPYPGVAKWVLLHGPTFPSLIPIIDRGTSLLAGAGFGSRTGFAYANLLNTAVLTISIGDERLLHEEDGPRDHAAMMTEFQRVTSASPGVEVLQASFIGDLARGGAQAAMARKRYYDFAIDVSIKGLEALLVDPAAD